MCDTLNVHCGADCTIVDTYWQNNMFYEIRQYTAKTGLCVTENMYTYVDGNGLSWTNFYKTYSSHSGYIRVGSIYDKGSWSN